MSVCPNCKTDLNGCKKKHLVCFKCRASLVKRDTEYVEKPIGKFLRKFRKDVYEEEN